MFKIFIPTYSILLITQVSAYDSYSSDINSIRSEIRTMQGEILDKEYTDNYNMVTGNSTRSFEEKQKDADREFQLKRMENELNRIEWDSQFK